MREIIKQKLKELGVDRIKIYRHKSPICHNIFTACLFMDEQGTILSRGIAICSVKDSYCKATGRGIAFGRAFEAIKTELSSEPINHLLPRWENKFVTRTLQIKKEKDENFFFNKIAPMLEQLNDEIGVNPDFAKVKVYLNEQRDGSTRKTFIYKIPRDYPIRETLKRFKYKSEFRPNLTTEEKGFLSS